MKSKESVDYYIKSIAELATVQYEIKWGKATENLEGTVVFRRGPNTQEFDLEVIMDCSAMFNADKCIANELMKIFYPELQS
jgi:hypothetical protein